jgi:hypothetical protein
MAGKAKQDGQATVYDSEQGLALVAQLQNQYVNQLLEVYGARVTSLQIAQNEWGVRVTCRIDFPLCEREANADLWSYFICRALFPGVDKFKSRTVPGETGFVIYCSFPVWSSVKYMESKRTDRNTLNF